MTDDEIFELMQVGSKYTRDQLADLANAFDDESRIFVSRALGRLKRWGKVKKLESGSWVVVPEDQRTEQTRKARAEAKVKKEKAEAPVKPHQPDDQIGSILSKPLVSPKRPVDASAIQNHEPVPERPSIRQAIDRVKGRLAGGVENINEKLVALEELGKYLDPTIDSLFKEIAADLRRMNGI